MQTEEYTTGINEFTPENVMKFTEAFMINNHIDPLSVLIDTVSITSNEEKDEYYIELIAAFPGALVGVGGVIAKKLASTMTKFFNKNLKLNIKH